MVLMTDEDLLIGWRRTLLVFNDTIEGFRKPGSLTFPVAPQVRWTARGNSEYSRTSVCPPNPRSSRAGVAIPSSRESLTAGIREG